MSKVKDIIIKPIKSSIANDFVIKNHYSGKKVNNSKLHFGCFLGGALHGVLSYGESIDKKRMLQLVKNTGWNQYLELNRMVFDDYLPKNSESRCIGITLRIIKKNYPHIKWIVSFADACQCGDGTIYRASGFKLIGIKKNTSLLKFKGRVISTKTLNNPNNKTRGMGACDVKRLGAVPIVGYQIKYIYLIDKTCEVTVPALSFEKIKELGASMYLGVGSNRGGLGDHPEKSGANPTPTLQKSESNQ